ncbi:MAG TPA: CopG family transcriptional regulator [Solirubrobacterales bacterium]|nr:CopG family transcriptional regulator [Solirubrobacterales bacterium]
MHRTQIYLDDDQTARLDDRAAAEGTSRSMLIRRAVDVYLSKEDRSASTWRTRWKEAVGDSAGIAPELGSGAHYVEDLRSKDAERLSSFER